MIIKHLHVVIDHLYIVFCELPVQIIGPQGHAHIRRFAGRLRGLSAQRYSWRRCAAAVQWASGRKTQARSGGARAAAVHALPSREGHMAKMWRHVHSVAALGHPSETHTPKVFMGSWFILPGAHENFRLAEGKQEFTTNHSVCTSSLDTVTTRLSVNFWLGILWGLDSQTPAKAKLAGRPYWGY